MSRNSIRDYVYMDVERLRSIYAQVSGGLIEQFIRSEVTNETMEHRENDEASEVKKQIFLGAGRFETRVLHDYLFTEVEKHLTGAIVDFSTETKKLVNPGSIVRVTGRSELDDTKRLLNIAEHYNEFYGSVLLLGVANEVQERIWSIEEELENLSTNSKNKERRLSLERELRSLSPEALIRRMKAGVPKIIIDMLRMWLELLYKDVFEVKILPIGDDSVSFRAVLDTQYLRENSSLTYAKYGSRTRVQWTLVGVITTILDPEQLGKHDEELSKRVKDHSGLNIEEIVNDVQSDEEAQNREATEAESKNESNNEANKNMRDAIENLFENIFSIERYMTVSAIRTSYVVTPLAIYHEISLDS